MIQLSMGDIVGADQTFLEHLSDRQYIVSHECRLAESFLLALKTRDPEMVRAGRLLDPFLPPFLSVLHAVQLVRR
jgi:hypothetical protein